MEPTTDPTPQPAPAQPTDPVDDALAKLRSAQADVGQKAASRAGAAHALQLAQQADADAAAALADAVGVRDGARGNLKGLIDSTFA